MNEDVVLLRQFVREGSEAAFRALVERRIGLVYAAALRQVGGDVHLAREVAQLVVIDLARRARALVDRPNLGGWLHTSTRFAAAKARRARARRMKYEHEAHAMNEMLSREPGGNEGAGWRELRPVIDAALHELGERDREALVLRFFEGCSLAEVGAGCGGLSENAARMRVERALEKLRGRLARRGITSTAAALGVALGSPAAVAVPAGLAAEAAGAGLASVTVGGAVALMPAGWAMNFMTTTKLAIGACGVMAALGLGAWFGGMAYQKRGDATASGGPGGDGEVAALRAENGRLREALELARGRTKAERAGDATRAAARETQVAEGGYAALRTLIDVRRRKLANLEFEFFGDGAQLEPAFVELFGISEAERAALQAAIDGAQKNLNALVREHTSVSRTPKGDVAIAVRPFPEAGGAIYDAVLKTFADTLGSERYTAFLALGAEQVEKKLGRFGTAERTILLSRDTSGGEVHYRINDHSRWSERDNSNYISHPMSPERLTREIGPLVDVLPADFLARR